MDITPDVYVEDLVAAHPKAIGWLAEHGVVCIRCGEPYWGQLGELMAEKHIPNPEALVAALNDFLAAPETDPS